MRQLLAIAQGDRRPMNAVEIADAVAALMEEPFDGQEFPYQFLAAFSFKETTLKKLRSGTSNTSDVPGAVLLRNNIHIAVADHGKTGERLAAIKASPKMAKAKCKFVFATDGEMVEAEELATGELLACRYGELADHFGFFLPLAGISTVAEIKDNPIDIKATGRLNKLYVQLLKDNEDWASVAKRPVLNQFMARLIFCFFAEDTGIFLPGLFTSCLQQMTDPQSTNTHEVIQKLFQAMDTPIDKRKEKKFPAWADQFPYVNGRLFTDQTEVPRFSKIARSYLLRVGELDWQQINPDIFGSMIQAVADDDERGSLGLHYTSVPNILKVLDPLFLDDLREQLDEAADNPRKLLKLRKRIANIRVFDPACGSGNFLVISYIKVREIEAEIVRRRKDEDKKSWIKLTSFYGIEIKSFPAEIARLALLIAEFQCNVRHIGQREACLDVLPLHDTGKIITGNALRLDWLKACPPPSKSSLIEEDLAGPTGRMLLDAQPEAETFICGNPPYVWANDQSVSQKEDMGNVFSKHTKTWKNLNYVSAWFLKASEYAQAADVQSAFVSINTVCQGQHVALLWPLIFERDREIFFAHTSFKWSNLASQNAGVTVVIVGLRKKGGRRFHLFSETDDLGATSVREVATINAYLIPTRGTIVTKQRNPLSAISEMARGNMPYDGGHLLLSKDALVLLGLNEEQRTSLVRRIYGSQEFIHGLERYCLWIEHDTLSVANGNEHIRERIEAVRQVRLSSSDEGAKALAARPHQFREMNRGTTHTVVMPAVSSENRQYLPAGLVSSRSVLSNRAYGMYDAPLWCFSLLASRLHWIWVSTVCGRLELRFSYTNTLGWNTFPVPTLTENDKAHLTRCAEDILLAREAHFPATIADLYDPARMPADLREAHERNDLTLERIYIGRRFKNDTERLEKLFEMYTKMIKDDAANKTKSAPKNGRTSKNDADAQGDQA